MDLYVDILYWRLLGNQMGEVEHSYSILDNRDMVIVGKDCSLIKLLAMSSETKSAT